MMGNKAIKTVKFTLCLLLASAILLGFLYIIKDAEKRYTARESEELERALRRASAVCYATEGVYPPDLEYLCEHYGIDIDEGRYSVFYDVFAENLMPDITVIERKQ